jgi:hypothetical protein
MNSPKFLTGTLVGGLALFLLGYLFYGLALAGFFTQHSVAPTGTMRPMTEIVWWALILGNIFWGAFLTYLFLKLGVSSFSNGAKTAAGFSFFVAMSSALIRYSTEMNLDKTGTLADAAVSIVMSIIAGGIIGAVLGAGKKKA